MTEIGKKPAWRFGKVVLDGRDVVFFRVGGRKISAGHLVETKKETRKPEVGNHLMCLIEEQPDGRLRAVKWGFAGTEAGVS